MFCSCKLLSHSQKSSEKMSTAQQQQPIMGATSTAAVAVALVQPPQLKMFDFLVSYRGLAATSVIFQHLAYFSKSYDVMHGFYFGVVSFFALSAFLLTYRLITLYERAGSSLLRIAQITVNYSIMRFFRIYVTFFAFCIIYSMLEYTLLGERKHQLELIASLVTLGRGARYTNFKRHGYLWTIPVEVSMSSETSSSVSRVHLETILLLFDRSNTTFAYRHWRSPCASCASVGTWRW